MVGLWRDITPSVAVLWVAFIGLAPGFAEEMLFRGYIQRRLLAAWSPGLAIWVTALAFGVVHLDPPAMALALVLGVWLGVVA